MKKFNTALNIFTALIALIGLFSPILWDRYTSRVQLTLSELSSISIPSPSIANEGVNISIDGIELPNATRYEFILSNTGYQPISKVYQFPTIDFQTDGSIIKVSRSTPVPSDNVELIRDTQNRFLTIQFDLLNPGDSITFTVWTTNEIEYRGYARVEGNSSLRVEKGSLPARDNLPDIFVLTASVILPIIYLVIKLRQHKPIKLEKVFEILLRSGAIGGGAFMILAPFFGYQELLINKYLPYVALGGVAITYISVRGLVDDFKESY